MEHCSMGAFLASLRKEQGLTQRQLAEELHVSEKSISRWERDETSPELALIPVLAERFGVTADELLRGQRAAHPIKKTALSEKQVDYLLKRTVVQYRMRSIVSLCMSLCGGLAGLLLILDGKRMLGLALGSAAQIVAALVQTAFTMGAFSSIDAEQYQGKMLFQARRKLVNAALWTYSHAMVWLVLTLVTLTDEFHIGVLVLFALAIVLWFAWDGVKYFLTSRGFMTEK